ncbi:MAG: restriction endonuclease [Pirellulaceae bacterium]|nr:restriction endonuclease [Thermoguttaceae bacterium]MDI9443940.1 restriction endonuclease [Planctomycetota bacterium]NLZ02414.1 restriction endonuclease [Pirellulaceae bacterium]
MFRVDHLYTHEEVYNSLGVGNAGGIRPALNGDGTVRRLVVMTAEPSQKIAGENPYHDRIEGDVLVFTAAGREGEQLLSGVNRRLTEQAVSGFPIYGFINIGSRRNTVLGKRRWRFLGLLQFFRYSQEMQPDTKGNRRGVWIFELLIHSSLQDVPVHLDATLSSRLMSEIPCLPDADREISVPESVAVSAEGAVPAEELENTRRSMLNMPPKKFEELTRLVLERTGFERVTVTRYSQDGGIDVSAYAGRTLWPLRETLVQVQAKRWLHSVGRREVAELRGSLHPYARGTIVTTSHFTRAAVLEARDAGKAPIVLVDGLDFSRLVIAACLQP